MGCVHTHQKKPTIERCDSLSYIWNVIIKIGENNQKVRKIDQIISQTPVLGLEHDIIQA
jgi:hypothetical protein